MKKVLFLLDKQAEHLNIHIEKRYRVTDNLVSDMISTVEAESPDILLLGAGPRFMTDGEKSMTSFFGLFRKKVDDVLEHASCPVAIFVNRDYRNGDEVAVLINGSMDSFLLHLCASFIGRWREFYSFILFQQWK